ncbi:40S ribosomal protein S13, partial [Tanacetum coccineum]
VEVAAPHKKLKVSTTRRRSVDVPNASSSTSRPVAVAPPKEQQVSTPSEIPKKLYDLIQKVAKLSETVKLNSNNRFAKRKLEYYKPWIHGAVAYYKATDQLPRGWKYDPETFFMAHVPKPPTPPKPKPKPKPKTKKKIKITWSSYNYHGSYPMNKDEQKIWNMFRMKDKAEANKLEKYPHEKHLHTVDDVIVVDLLGKFAVNTFNKSCKEYVNKDEDNQVSGAEFMECKFYKLTTKYIFYMTIEAVEQGIRGVYDTRVECVTENGEMTLQNFVLTDREPKWNRPWVKPRLESEFEYETVQDGSSDPQDFYQLTGMVHRLTESGGFNYHNPAYSPHILIYCGCKDKKASSFEVNVDVAAPPKTLKVSTRRRRSVPNTSSTVGDFSVAVAPPKELEVSTITPSEIPKRLYDLIQNAARARKSLKLNSNNRFAKRKLEYYESSIHRVSGYCKYITEELPSDWIYDPETSFMAHVPKGPTPPKPKTKKKKKKTEKKKIKITYIAEAKTDQHVRVEKHLNTVDKDDKVVDLLGKFAVDTFNRSCQMFCVVIYLLPEAIEQGIPGVYEARVESGAEDGAKRLMNFTLTDREPKWNRPWVKPRLEPKEYETVQDGSSDPQDFYELTGMVHRETEGGGFDYYNPPFATHRINFTSTKDEEALAFVPNVRKPLQFPVAAKTIPMDC